jgi:cytochrome c oxidase cbb3-type subunit I/II
MQDPRAITRGSIMPGYPWMLTAELDFAAIPGTMRAHRSLGVPYSDADIAGAVEHAAAQAKGIADEIVTQGGPPGLNGSKVVALIAYLQRLGTDIMRPEPAPQPASPQSEPAAAADAVHVAEAR